MSRDDATRAYYDDFSKWYERERGRGYHALIDDLEFEITAPFARGKRCLEVGCGTGLILERVAAVASEAVGIDLSPGMLEKARERGLDGARGARDEAALRGRALRPRVLVQGAGARARDRDRARRDGPRHAPGGTMLAEFYNPWSLRYLAKTLGPAQKVSEKTHRGGGLHPLRLAPRIEAILPSHHAARRLPRRAGVHPDRPRGGAAGGGAAPAAGRAPRARSPLARLGGFLIAVIRRV
jgi:SAM-dependent methyltransferase